MYIKYRSFENLFQKKNVDVLWRYMNIDKFLDLLTSESLHFTRIDRLWDQSEGKFSGLKSFDNSDRSADSSNSIQWLEDAMLTKIFVNCWCAENDELLPMWGLYSDKHFGIAIKTRLERLRKSLNGTGQEYISPVIYDPSDDEVVESGITNDLLFPYVLKRKVFSFENEVRIVRWPWNEEFQMFRQLSDADESSSPLGHNPAFKEFTTLEYDDHSVDVDLKELIEEVVVSPYAEEWLVRSLKRLFYKFELEVPVRISNI